MNSILWKPKAARQLRKLSLENQRKIYSDVTDKLSVFPNCQGIKKLVNHAYSYRLRVGNFRVFFEFNGNINVVEIEEVKKRDEHTY